MEKKGMKRIDLGPTGKQVAENVARLRATKNLTYAALAKKLAESGRAISELALRRIEAQARRVDADDLTALAIALEVSPLTLLLPFEGDVDPIELTGLTREIAANVAWLWATGEEPLTLPAVPLSPKAQRAIMQYRLFAKPDIEARELPTEAGESRDGLVVPGFATMAELQGIELRG